ncbi:MAG: exo-alpha-sialidase, partial [Verrucomicrobia bacterium]|nr:exo-alpha-sialidase [Verrucomicrobiota bacterium]
MIRTWWDHLLFFDDCWFPVGTAFLFEEAMAPAPNQPARVRLTSPSDPDRIAVAKRVFTLDNRKVLIESVNYTDVLPKLKTLQQAALPGDQSNAKRQVAQGRKLPPLLSAERQDKPLLLASVPYTPRGLVLDYYVPPSSANSFTFTNGQTYAISNSFSVGPGTATVQNNTAVKSATNAYLLLYGPVIFPSSGFPAFFTSVDDNAYGEQISGSTSSPNYAAAQAIWMYFHTSETTVSNVRIRWAQRGIQYDENPGVTVSPTLSGSGFMNCKIGAYVNIPNDTLTLSFDTKCEVDEPVHIESGGVSGSMTDDCGVVSVARVNNPWQDTLDGDPNGDPNKNSQSECSFVIVDANRIVAAWFSTHLSEYGLGEQGNLFTGITSPRSIWWTVSNNGGTSFITNATPLSPSPPTARSEGDAGDPVMARDTLSSPTFPIYLLGNPSREPGFKGLRLWKSTNDGQTFTLINTNVPGGFDQCDKPMIAVNNFPNLSTSGNLYVVGTRQGDTPGVFAARSLDGGTTWPDTHSFGMGHGADVVIRPNGTVYVFYLANDSSGTKFWIQYHWRTIGGSWQGPAPIGTYRNINTTNLYASGVNGSGKLKRFGTATADDYFDSFAIPRVAVHSTSSRIYVVYGDVPLPEPGSADRGDIFIKEGIGADGALSWSGEVKVSNDRTTTDQWLPSVTINPSGSHVFVGYYSRQKDTTDNAWIRAYGAKAFINNGLAGATFDVFPIDSVSFTNLFPGTLASTPSNNPWLFDNVWCQVDVCLDNNARVVDCASPATVFTTRNQYQHFAADDYTWVSADNSRFYFAWCDRYEPCILNWGGTNYIRRDPNIR